jgi:hypothetical protein
VRLAKDKRVKTARRLDGYSENPEGYLAEHPYFTLKEIVVARSSAQGTALRSLDEIEVACYIIGANASHDVIKLLNYRAERLRKAFLNLSADQIKPQDLRVLPYRFAAATFRRKPRMKVRRSKEERYSLRRF